MALFSKHYLVTFKYYTMADRKNKSKAISNQNDIADSSEDVKRLQPENADINLPDIEDIPGQKHVHVPKLREAIDTTTSSDDEEGKGIFDENEDLEDDSNVTDE